MSTIFDAILGRERMKDGTALVIPTSFLDLADVPSDYTGQAGMAVVVNPGETGLEFQLGTSPDEKVKIDVADTVPGYLNGKLLEGNGVDFVVSAGPNKTLTIQLNSSELQSIIEAFTALDLSGVQLTLGEILGDITFGVGTTIDRTNTTNTGTQNFDANYIANYTGSLLNFYGVTQNFDNTCITNNNGNTINNNSTIENNVGVINNFDDTSDINYEGDIYIGGNIIVMNNNVNNGGTVNQDGPGVAYTDLNNVLLCDLAVATATPIDPTAKDSIKLIVGGAIAGNDLGQGITGGNPAVYGSPSNLRGNVLTPTIVNNANFGVSFKFGDSQTINVTNFGFTIPGTDTILGIKAEVIFNSTADTVNVDCITLVVYHTAGTPIAGGVQSVTGLDTDNTDPLNPVVQIAIGAGLSGAGTPASPLIATGSFADTYNNYLVLTDTMAGTPPEVDIADTRITDTTPYVIFYETQPVGNITRTLTNGNLNIASDNNADTLDVKVVFMGIGPARQYMKGLFAFTGTTHQILDPRIVASSAVVAMPRPTPVGYITGSTDVGEINFVSTGTEVGVLVDYVVFNDGIAFSDGMPYNDTLDDDDILFRKSAVSGDDEAVKWSDMKGTITPTASSFGDGSDGDVTISGTVTITRDMYYNNLDVPTGQILNTNGYRIYVLGTLTGAGKIQRNGNNGTNASLNTAGTGGAALNQGSLNADVRGGNGGAGTASSVTLSPGEDGISCNPSYSNIGGADGGGGERGTPQGPGIGGTSTRGQLYNIGTIRAYFALIGPASYAANTTQYKAISGSGGGGGGRGNGGAIPGGGGGGAGGNGGIIRACINIVNRTGTREAKGGNGGNGAVGPSGDGGGGGGGGNGGVLVLFYGTLTSIGTKTFTKGNKGLKAGGAADGVDGNDGVSIEVQI